MFLLMDRYCPLAKEAAFELGIAPSTVYTYTERIRQRLEVTSIGEIVNYAKQWRKLNNS
ncbi:MAG: hypothetical protein JKY56_27770 [Kofleriaceae bacterium]|nr:hypothetical protein [Kofleriaceae bacterium]